MAKIDEIEDWGTAASFKIIFPGKREDTEEAYKFRCEKCGCIFEQLSRSVWHPIGNTFTTDITENRECNCPNCCNRCTSFVHRTVRVQSHLAMLESLHDKTDA